MSETSISRTFALARDGLEGSYIARGIGDCIVVAGDAPCGARLGTVERPPQLHSAQYVVQCGPYRQHWPVHEQFELFNVREGSAVYTIGGEELQARPGSIILLKSFSPHATLLSEDERVMGINLHFSPGSLLPELENVDELALAASAPDRLARMAPLFVDILEESRRPAVGARNCADAYLHLLLVECLREFGLTARAGGDSALSQNDLVTARLERCTRFIHEHLHEELTLERLADEVALSPDHLSHTFSRFFRTTLTRYVTEARMKHAAEMLQSTALPLKEIAARIGYSDEFYFSKVFKRFHGMPPHGYRKAHARRRVTA